MSAMQLWAAGLLALRRKPEGGTEYHHTLVVGHAPTSELAAANAINFLRQLCPPSEGWQGHQAQVAGMGEPPPVMQRLSVVFREVWSERMAQETKYGGEAHDNELTGGDWLRLVHTKLIRAQPLAGTPDHEQGLEYRRRLIQVAATAIAAVQAFDRGAKLT